MKYIAILAIVAASPAAAEVVSADAHDFEVRETVHVRVPPTVAWSAFQQIGKWWSPDHTYSGNSSNLSLTAMPGGCFCERMPQSAGVEHLRVAAALPPQRLVLTGALGPLLYEGVAGVMDIKFGAADGNTTVSLDYRASGFVHGNAAEIAKGVDSVLADQLARYARFAGPAKSN